MKMETTVTAPISGFISRLGVKPGASIEVGDLIAHISAGDDFVHASAADGG